jgi:hypothetical protein
VNYERMSAVQFEWQAEPQTVPATEIEPERVVNIVADAIEENLSDALQAFAEHWVND